MRIPTPRNAREVAFSVLCADFPGEAFVNKRLDAQLQSVPLSDADRRLATELTYGIVRREATLDALLKTCVRRPQNQVEPRLWTLLRLGAYQLTFLSNVPPHAAVHATVDLTKWCGMPAWSGLANGVLRALGRKLTERFDPVPSRQGIPLAANRYRIIDSEVFPDPLSDPAGYFSLAFSFPRWLAERWQNRLAWPDLLRTGFWFNSATPICLRVNRLKTTRALYEQALAKQDVAYHLGASPDAIWLDGGARIEQLPGFASGLVSVQDESAMQAGYLLAPQPGERVLDLCAAPGGKTTHIAELMQNQGQIDAVDVRRDRLELVDTACQRLGIEIVRTHLLGGELDCLPTGEYDAVLVDVPCSNSGVLGKRPEARWRIQPADLRELTVLQARLARTAASRLRTGGRLIYSTCSIEPEENVELVRVLTTESLGLRLVRDHQHLPGQPGDGGYQAFLEKVP